MAEEAVVTSLASLPIIWDAKWGGGPALSIPGLLYVRGETNWLPWWGEL